MSATTAPAPFFALPGFMPDAANFATRFTAACIGCPALSQRSE